jgi:hypothetical protein
MGREPRRGRINTNKRERVLRKPVPISGFVDNPIDGAVVSLGFLPEAGSIRSVVIFLEGLVAPDKAQPPTATIYVGNSRLATEGQLKLKAGMNKFEETLQVHGADRAKVELTIPEDTIIERVEVTMIYQS